MRKILFILLLLPFIGQAQDTKTPFANTATPVANRFAFTNNGLWVDSTVKFVKYKQVSDSVLLGVDANGKLYTITKEQVALWGGGGSGGAIWGSITGTLLDQLDLKAILDTKANQTALEDTAAAIRADFPTGSTLTATQVGFGDGSNALSGEAAFNYNSTTNKLTADTVSVVGLRLNNVINTDPLIRVNPNRTNGGSYLLYWPSTISDTSEAFRIFMEDQSGGDGTNYPVKMGFNPAGSYTPTRPGIHLSMEPHYAPGAGDWWMEYMLQAYGPGGSWHHSRLFMSTFRFNDAALSIENATNIWDFRGNSFNIMSLNDLSYFSTLGNTATSAAQFVLSALNGSAGLKGEVNGVDNIVALAPIVPNGSMDINLWSLWNFTGASIVTTKDTNGIHGVVVDNPNTGVNSLAGNVFRNDADQAILFGISGSNYVDTKIEPGTGFLYSARPLQIVTSDSLVLKGSSGDDKIPDVKIKDGVADFRLSPTVPDAVNDNEAVNLGQLNTIVAGGFVSLSIVDDTVHWDMSISPYAKVTLTQDAYLHATNWTAKGDLVVTQDGTGGWELELPVGYKLAYNEEEVIYSPNPGAIDKLEFSYLGSDVSLWDYDTKYTGTDPLVANFVTASAGEGITLTPTEINALTALVGYWRANNIIDKFRAVYPMVGSAAGSHKLNLIDPQDADASFRMTFSGGGWTHNASGAKGDGTASYGNTHFSADTEFGLDPFNIGVYLTTTPTAAADEYLFGAFQSSTSLFGMAAEAASQINYYWFNTTFGTVAEAADNFMALSSNGVNVTAYTSLSESSQAIGGTRPPEEIYLSALHIGGGGPYGHSDGTVGFMFMAEQMTDDEMDIVRTSVTTFQTALGRN